MGSLTIRDRTFGAGGGGVGGIVNGSLTRRERCPEIMVDVLFVLTPEVHAKPLDAPES
jgi:hypothetical protein